MQTPTMVYKYPGKHQLQDGSYDWLIVDESEVEDALKDGWFRTKEEAKAAMLPKTEATPIAEPVEDAPPTRDELEQKAKELGLKFDGRTNDKKLATMIAEKV